MGGWKAKNTNDVLGDLPLDELGNAVTRVVKHYKDAFGRRPSIAEWEKLLGLALGHEEAEYRCSDEPVLVEVHITGKPVAGWYGLFMTSAALHDDY